MRRAHDALCPATSDAMCAPTSRAMRVGILQGSYLPYVLTYTMWTRPKHVATACRYRVLLQCVAKAYHEGHSVLLQPITKGYTLKPITKGDD